MNSPVSPSQSAKHLTSDRMQQHIDHVSDNAALPHEEAADPFYESYLCDQIKVMAEDMQFPEQWAAEIGVTEVRMFSWVGKYPEFTEAYAVAITKLRAAFTTKMLEIADGKREGAIGTLWVLIAKKRFADIYGDAPVPSAGLPAPRDITPAGDQTIDGTAISDMEVDQLQSELDALRRRHSDV